MPSWGETAHSQASSREVDGKLFEWCLSYFPEGDELPESDEAAKPRERPVEKLPPFDLEGVTAPPDLIKETVIVGNVPDAIKAYQGLWITPMAGKSWLPYAAYVERLTPMEMTIALLHRPPEGQQLDSTKGLRQTLAWDGTGFESKTANLLGMKDVTFRVQISRFGDALGLGWAGDREGYLLGCLISSKHY